MPLKKKNSSVVFKVCVAAQIFSVVFGLLQAARKQVSFLQTILSDTFIWCD